MYTVLIVEDEILVSAGLKSMVSWSDMNMVIVGEARNGKQGLEMYREKKPDLILTDIKMPVMDGLSMITQIRKEDSQTKIIVLTGYEDFELVREAFMLGISDYILKLKMLPEEMETVIRKVYDELLLGGTQMHKNDDKEEEINRVNENRIRLRDYILHAVSGAEEIKPVMGALQVKEDDLFVGVMEIAQTSPKTRDGCHTEEVEQVILSLVRNILSEYDGGEIFRGKGAEYLLVANVPDGGQPEKTEFLLDMLSRIQTAIQAYINCSVVLGSSSLSDDCGELRRLYKEAERALAEARLYGEGISVFGEKDYRCPYEEILTAFETRFVGLDGIGEDYRRKIQREITFMKKIKNPRRELIQEILIRWFHQASTDGGIMKEEMFKFVLNGVDRIREARSLREMLAAFEECLLSLIQSMKDTKIVRREVAEVVKYIQDHYWDEELSISLAAQAVALNKDYLSNLFKKETGISFSDYVNLQRIKKAQELLTGTHLRTYQIAQQVGFQDESYFSRVFKKIVGMRPGEYRKCEIPYGDFVDR
ncbi:MAG: response regulator [Lachnospiraceae bacterium]|nr:response regulator [Lachnospiraceae bacterium]